MLLFNYYLSFLYTHYYKSNEKLFFKIQINLKKSKIKKIGFFSYLFIIGGGVITYGR